MQMMMAAWLSQTIAAVTRLGVPELLGRHGPLSARRARRASRRRRPARLPRAGAARLRERRRLHRGGRRPLRSHAALRGPDVELAGVGARVRRADRRTLVARCSAPCRRRCGPASPSRAPTPAASPTRRRPCGTVRPRDEVAGGIHARRARARRLRARMHGRRRRRRVRAPGDGASCERYPGRRRHRARPPGRRSPSPSVTPPPRTPACGRG